MLGVVGSWPLKICRRGQSMFWSPKKSRSFVQNCCWITLQVSHHQGWKACQKWKVKLIFWGPTSINQSTFVKRHKSRANRRRVKWCWPTVCQEPVLLNKPQNHKFSLFQCLEIIDIGCNLKLFNRFTWLHDSDPQSFTTDLRHCVGIIYLLILFWNWWRETGFGGRVVR